MRSWMRRVMRAVRAAVLLPRERPVMQEQEARALLEALRQARPGSVVPLPVSLGREPLLVARLLEQVRAEQEDQLMLALVSGRAKLISSRRNSV
jgi:hypothetical protein